MASKTSQPATSFATHRDQAASDQAIEWLARLRASDVTAEEKAQFAEWLNSSALNKRAFDDATTLWEGLRLLPEQTSPQYRPRRQFVPLAAAAAVVLSLVVVMTQFSGQDYTTGMGEQRRVMLTDGSTAFLNTRSAIHVEFDGDERRIELIDGEVWFDVVADSARPFRVIGAYATAEAVGTGFVVRQTPGYTRIGVTEGIVNATNTTGYRGKLKSILLNLGDQGTFSSQSTDAGQFDPEDNLAWRGGRLVYRNVRLEALLDDLNRYLPNNVVVNDETLANERVTGTLLLEDPSAMLEALERIFELKATQVSDRLIIVTKT